MRSLSDPPRHAIGFELPALGLMVPPGAVLFHRPLRQIGALGVAAARLATLWNLDLVVPLPSEGERRA